MRRSAKVKPTVACLPLRRPGATVASARGWLATGEPEIVAPAKSTVTPRVRDGLVLRLVDRTKPALVRSLHGPGAR